MKDLLNNIDGRATQEAVEAVLRQYRTYMLTTPEDMMPTVTAHIGDAKLFECKAIWC
ncbi:hypothetical protein [Lysinibacillus fusiformis]